MADYARYHWTNQSSALQAVNSVYDTRHEQGVQLHTLHATYPPFKTGEALNQLYLVRMQA